MFPQSHELRQMLHHPYMPSPMEQRSRWKPSVEVAPNCPRCASTNTKFCYYNNYSLSQPRYFCKGCRRYWTKGGSLRNVPVGGGCRKNRRGKSSRSHQSQRPFACVSEDRESSIGDDNNGSRDIDMALVFAKFLNPKASTGAEEFESEANNIKPLSDPTEELSLSHGIDELERLLDEDDLWSDATLSSSVSWQPPAKHMQFQELEYSMMPFDDYAQLLPITSASTMTDTCWNSFDLSTIEMFSSTP